MPVLHTSDGANLFYTDTGAGHPIICLSGLTRTHRDFDFVMPHLTGRVLRMDYRGRGQSDWTGPTTYTVHQEAIDTFALMDHLNIDRAGILGTSRGGIVAMAMAAIDRDRISGVALNDVGPVIGPGFDPILDRLGHHPEEPDYAAALVTRRASEGFANVPDARWLQDLKNNFDETPDGLRNRYDSQLRSAVLHSFKKGVSIWELFDALAGMPVLTIRGLGSTLLTAQTLSDMVARRPDMIVAKVPDRGHVPFLDEPEAVAGLTEWIGKLS